MPAERIGMRDVREIIRLKFASISTHEIGRRLGLARSTVRETLKRAEGAGLSWPLPDDMNDEALEAALYASRRSKRGHRRIAEPDWASVHRELKRKHVTLLILEASPDKQVSLTDPDARSMATSGKGTGIVGYNVQMALDAEHHLIVVHEVTNIGSNRSQLTSMGHKAQEATGCDELTVLADRGYLQHEAHDQHLRRQTAHAGNSCLIKVSRHEHSQNHTRPHPPRRSVLRSGFHTASGDRRHPQQPVPSAQISALQASLRRESSSGVLLLKTQAIPPCRNPLRKDRTQLPRSCNSRRHHLMGAISVHTTETGCYSQKA